MNTVIDFEVRRANLIRRLEEYLTAVKDMDVYDIAIDDFLQQLQDEYEKTTNVNIAFVAAVEQVLVMSRRKVTSAEPFHLCFVPS